MDTFKQFKQNVYFFKNHDNLLYLILLSTLAFYLGRTAEETEKYEERKGTKRHGVDSNLGTCNICHMDHIFNPMT